MFIIDFGLIINEYVKTVPANPKTITTKHKNTQQKDCKTINVKNKLDHGFIGNLLGNLPVQV